MRKTESETGKGLHDGILAFLSGLAGPLMFFAPPRPDLLFSGLDASKPALRRRSKLPYWVRAATATIQRNAAYIQRNVRAP